MLGMAWGLVIAAQAVAAPGTPVSVQLPLKAVGHAPEWTLDVGGGQFVLTFAADEQRVVLPIGAPVPVPGGQRFDARRQDGVVPVTVIARLCVDEATGTPRPYQVTIVDGDRELKGCGGDPTALLRGGLWTVDDLQGTTPLPKSPMTLVFAPGGRLEGSTGCNRYVATYVLTGDQLQVSMPISTMRGCPPPVMQQERAFLDVLRSVQRFGFEPDGALILTGADGSRMRARR